ncbi:type 1 glutamine amidotransferase [Roseovarius autotrophicus]|uniref:type 1 glutamine amidotransferase n=1 Tax=Roseovarius autotrophicus TaxID=2824121 RepID=UPI001A0D0F00|nr:type 1 glutamine amidotransferase [Roseovarius autotrophicus]MBE0452096.1 type 1 glutamine amidotransferase [Roseovarius sp.]
MRIGILKTGHAPDIVLGELGDYDAMFARLLDGHGFEFDAYDVVDGIFPDGAHAADGWLVTGSKHGVYEDHPWIAPLEALIRAIRDAGRPLVGVCFGHQIIAQALGGEVIKHPGGWRVGPTEYEIDGTPLTLNAWHQDQVVLAPPGAEVVGRAEGCEIAALRLGDRILTVQPHPEFDATMMDRLIEYRAIGVVPDPLRDHARALLDTPTDSAAMAGTIADVLRKGARHG